jgi:hypothetical protein
MKRFEKMWKFVFEGNKARRKIDCGRRVGHRVHHLTLRLHSAAKAGAIASHFRMDSLRFLLTSRRRLL